VSSSLDSGPISKLCVNCCSTQSLDACDDFEDSDPCSGVESNGKGCDSEGGLDSGGDGREDVAMIWSNFYKLVVPVIENLETYIHSGGLPKEHIVLN